MRIQLLAEKTGVSKRTIHYYIKEKLLSPEINISNGYYNFSEDDYHRLLLIRNLRDAGFSVSVIKSLINNPASTEYYFRMRISRIEQEVEKLKNTSSSLCSILNELPVNPTFSDLCTLTSFTDETEYIDTPQYDGFLVNHFLWRTFWQSEQLTEYQQFLWNKINRLTDSRDKNIHYARLYDYLCQQNQKKIDALYKERNAHFNRVAELSEEGVLLYAQEMKSSIKEFIQNRAAVRQWKEHYHSFIIPQMNIFTADIGRIAEEMSPFFHAYKSKSGKACHIVFQWLHTDEGRELYKEILSVLEGYVDLEHHQHAELESMNTVFEY